MERRRRLLLGRGAEGAGVREAACGGGGGGGGGGGRSSGSEQSRPAFVVDYRGDGHVVRDSGYDKGKQDGRTEASGGKGGSGSGARYDEGIRDGHAEAARGSRGDGHVVRDSGYDKGKQDGHRARGSRCRTDTTNATR